MFREIKHHCKKMWRTKFAFVYVFAFDIMINVPNRRYRTVNGFPSRRPSVFCPVLLREHALLYCDMFAEIQNVFYF